MASEEAICCYLSACFNPRIAKPLCSNQVHCTRLQHSPIYLNRQCHLSNASHGSFFFCCGHDAKHCNSGTCAAVSGCMPFYIWVAGEGWCGGPRGVKLKLNCLLSLPLWLSCERTLWKENLSLQKCHGQKPPWQIMVQGWKWTILSSEIKTDLFHIVKMFCCKVLKWIWAN